MTESNTAAAPERVIGPHLALGTGLLKAADRAREIGATAVQIFTDNPTAWRRRREPPAKLDAFRERLAQGGIVSLAVHAPYLINLCGGNEDFWHKSIASVANELEVGSTYGAAFVVMHIGSHRGLGREEGIRRLVAGMSESLKAADELHTQAATEGGNESEAASYGRSGRPPLPKLVLENAPGSGDAIGASMEDLADIFEASAAAGLDMARLGVCLDTAHLWAAGYDLATSGGAEALLHRIDGILGRERVVMLHLNDSKTVVGSRVDRHEHIGAGQMGPRGIGQVVGHPWLANLPTFLETPGMDTGYDAVNLRRVRLILDGQELPDLPPEAFTLRSSRSRSGPPQV
ncbi:MAG TPA: deoxyribonuclease IV [Candidatus Limnocylindrales bacterium]|nr:deoxyribonuclease IV [Candidatus Limnocylindrales bacterium]